MVEQRSPKPCVEGSIPSERGVHIILIKIYYINKILLIK